MDMNVGDINLLLVLGIIVITIVSVVIITKFFNTNKKNNAKELVDKNIQQLRK